VSDIEDVAVRILELVKSDPELHAAVLRLINSTAEAKEELAAYRRRKQ